MRVGLVLVLEGGYPSRASKSQTRMVKGACWRCGIPLQAPVKEAFDDFG